MYEIKSYQDSMKDRLVDNLRSLFPNAEKRIAIWAETEKYHWKEDESVWNQKKGRTAPQYEAHFDGEFVCFIDSSKSDKYNVSEFLINIRKLYVDGKIFVNQEMYEVMEAKREAESQKDVLEVPKPVNEAEEMIVKTIKKQAKRRKRKARVK